VYGVVQPKAGASGVGRQKPEGGRIGVEHAKSVGELGVLYGLQQ
jgi:hypothetical protein